MCAGENLPSGRFSPVVQKQWEYTKDGTGLIILLHHLLALCRAAPAGVVPDAKRLRSLPPRDVPPNHNRENALNGLLEARVIANMSDDDNYTQFHKQGNKKSNLPQVTFFMLQN